MTIDGILLDLEGVLYEGEQVIDGAVDAVRTLAATGLTLRFLTNTTTRPRAALVTRLESMGIEVEPRHLFTPAVAAQTYLADQGIRRLCLVCEPALADDFSGFVIDDEAPQAVIMGDLYKGFDWDCLNRAFQHLIAGARLIALHKNRYTRRASEGLSLDLGPFVAALEYAAGQSAVVVGKPSPTFFEMALRDMGLTAARVVMVGDDIDSDIGGAAAAGIGTIQVRTGKFSARDEARTDIRPDHLIDTVRDLSALLGRIG